MKNKRHTLGGETLALKKETAHSQKEAGRQNDHGNSTKRTDPLLAWHSLAKPSRNRQPKGGWRRKAGGAIDPALLGLLAVLAVAILLHTGVI